MNRGGRMQSAPSGRRLRLVLGDQLNARHSWFLHVDPEVTYVLMEVRQETDYVRHHAQKILAIFAAMRRFADDLRKAGHAVIYLKISDPSNQQQIEANLQRLIQAGRFETVEYLWPDEWRLDACLRNLHGSLGIPVSASDTEHFLAPREAVGQFFGTRKRWVMEHFYRDVRKRLGVLLDANGAPEGGEWNLDHANRKAWRGTPKEPIDARPLHDHGPLWDEILAQGVCFMGDPSAGAFRWPIDRSEALAQLEYFVSAVLPHFGDFQDAMHTGTVHLFHSLLSFALNVKLLNPREVVERVEDAYRRGHCSLASAEGYIRQVIGWREYVRGVYWAKMPGYRDLNTFGHERALPEWFWSGETRMACLRHSIGQSLSTAYAHHIQRLMVIGNFALLSGLHPKALHEWYLGIYIDAFEWVELPNTLGMSQHADGGFLATKPYVSSAAYLDRMSDYCKTCPYDRNERYSDKACPFNALYWDFFIQRQGHLATNPRLGMTYRHLKAMTSEEKSRIEEKAKRLLAGLNAL